jgi:hypothetical protein
MVPNKHISNFSFLKGFQLTWFADKERVFVGDLPCPELLLRVYRCSDAADALLDLFERVIFCDSLWNRVI